jgi:hypothetical protein
LTAIDKDKKIWHTYTMNSQYKAIVITRPKQGLWIHKTIQGKHRTGTGLLNRYMQLVNKWNISIPENMMIL